MEINWKTGIVAEHGFLRMQQMSRNLNSYKPYPMPGRLVEIAYPLEKDGKRVEPVKLAEYAKVRSFDMPQCYHARDCVVTSRLDPFSKQAATYLECCMAPLASKIVGLGEMQPCSFLIYLNQFLSEDSTADFCFYNIRPSIGSFSVVNTRIASDVLNFTKMLDQASSTATPFIDMSSNGILPSNKRSSGSGVAPPSIFPAPENVFHSTNIQSASNGTFQRGGGVPSMYSSDPAVISELGVPSVAPRPVIALAMRNDAFGSAWSSPFLGSGRDDVHMGHPTPLEWSREDLRSVVDHDEADYESSEYDSIYIGEDGSSIFGSDDDAPFCDRSLQVT